MAILKFLALALTSAATLGAALVAILIPARTRDTTLPERGRQGGTEPLEPKPKTAIAPAGAAQPQVGKKPRRRRRRSRSRKS